LVPVTQVAAYLSLSTTGVRRLVTTGELPSYRLSTSSQGSLRLRLSEVDAWAQGEATGLKRRGKAAQTVPLRRRRFQVVSGRGLQWPMVRRTAWPEWELPPKAICEALSEEEEADEGVSEEASSSRTG
jgi:excisionase family DNA binding protein